ncbi:unnamed protein product [Knipowitschia caucasica]|uniref:Uncharacterized protein n=1 Tax=Knipowitschia caucasica TaxID=637954 RepID=A0AAV2MQV1_KNICA
MTEIFGQDQFVDTFMELQKAQLNENVSKLRLKDSQNHAGEMENMLHLLEEVQVAKMCGDRRLEKTQEKVFILNKKIKRLEKMLQQHHACPLFALGGHCKCYYSKESNDETGRLRHPPAPNELNKESQQQSINKLSKHVVDQECIDMRNQECVDQEMAVLSSKLSFSSSNTMSFLADLQLLKKLVDQQKLHNGQITELSKAQSSHEKKFSFLEEHIICLQTQLWNAQEERTKWVQQTHKPKEYKVCCEDLFRHQKEVNILKERLEVALKQLHTTEKEELHLQASVEQKTWEEKTSQELSENKKYSMIEAKNRSQKLYNVIHDLKIKLLEHVKMNEELSSQLNQLKTDILHLKAELDRYKRKLAAVEQDKFELQASEAQHKRYVQEEILAKRHLKVKLEKQQMALLSLTEEHKELQLLYSCMNKEKEGVVLKLQSHLKNVQIELDQAKSTLRTLEQEDNHGTQLDKEITTRRQIDCLQRIKNLEERKKTLCQEDTPFSDLESLLFKEPHEITSPQPLKIIAPNIWGRSAPKRVQSAALCHHLKTSKLKETVHNIVFHEEPFTLTPLAPATSPQLLGRRSPVHSLLTSDPHG